MRLRDGSYDPNNDGGHGGAGFRDPVQVAAGAGADGALGPLRWRVPGAQVALKAAGALVFAGAAVLLGNTVGLVVGGLAAVLLAGLALRDVLVPVRVEADADGITIAVGFAGRRRLAWADIDAVRVDERMRLGTRSRLLEIDAGETLHLFGSFELGTSVETVAEQLQQLRATAESHA